MSKRPLTWTATGLWTVLALVPGGLAGIFLVSQQIYLAPSLTPYTFFFYLAVAALPGLVVFGLCIRQEPGGGRVMVFLLPILAGTLLCFYLALLGPVLSVDIQCPAWPAGSQATLVECQCGWNRAFAINETPPPQPCLVQRWRFIPLVQRVSR